MSPLRLILAAAASLTLLGAAAPSLARTGDEPVIDYAASDAQMNAAIAEARRTLPVFWRASAAGADKPMIKVGFPTPQGGDEHMWVVDIHKDGDRYTAVLANEPRDIPDMHNGDPVSFTADMISDWTYERDGRLWGGYTMRVMLPELDAATRADLSAYLSPTPLEAGDR